LCVSRLSARRWRSYYSLLLLLLARAGLQLRPRARAS
jgi:hypothetical protein